MNWPPYPEYKNSGIEWLGDVPSSWGVAEIKLTHQVTLGKMLQTEASGSGMCFFPTFERRTSRRLVSRSMTQRRCGSRPRRNRNSLSRRVTWS